MQGDIQGVPANHSYGRKVEKLEGVDGVIKAQNMNGFVDKTNDVLEGKYASATRECGISEYDFQVPRSRDQGKALFEKNRLHLQGWQIQLHLQPCRGNVQLTRRHGQCTRLHDGCQRPS